jgi:hypothetical protein
MADRPNAAQRSVHRFTAADNDLKEFLADSTIRDIMSQFEHLVQLRNQALDEAVRAVKQELRNLDQDRLVIDGIGAQKKYKRWYDPEFLANALPAEQSDLILTEKTVYELDQDRLEQLARQGEIDNEIVRRAFHEEEQAPAALPGTPKAYVIPSLPVE